MKINFPKIRFLSYAIASLLAGVVSTNVVAEENKEECFGEDKKKHCLNEKNNEVVTSDSVLQDQPNINERILLSDTTTVSSTIVQPEEMPVQSTVNSEHSLFKVKPSSDEVHQRIIESDMQNSVAQAGIGKTTISLPNKGLIWVTEDVNAGQPTLSVSAPSYTAFSGGKITDSVRFFIRSNYSAFVDRYELSLYRATDVDLVEPLTILPIQVGGISSYTWNGQLPAQYNFRTGDKLIYVLRAYNQEGNFDETSPGVLELVTPEDAERGTSALKDTISKDRGVSLSVDEAIAQSLLNNVVDSNNLTKQNIPIYGSKIRIQGSNIPKGSVLINQESYPVDQDRKFSSEFLLPVGQHSFDITVENEGNKRIERKLDIDISGNSFFMVAIADITAYQHKASGSGQSIALGDKDKDILTDARLAFYMKSKLHGKYVFTAQADTTERYIGDLFSGFTRADPKDLFRTLDPDLYYPTYGDDSTVYRDVDTQGRFYFRVDWGKNQALWGNYNTGIGGTEYARYTRSLYGGALNWYSDKNNKWGDPSTEIRAFGSEAQSAPGHTEFLGTGGSLYYLKHANILSGSDKAQLEVRDKRTGRVEVLVPMVRGVDYEIDSIQGRLTLTRPLAQLVRENTPSITRDEPLDGYEQRLVVDYEWVPSGFEADSVTAGIRAKQWIGDHVAVGATYVDENQAGKDYTIKGADITLKAGNGTYLKAEYTKTEASSVPIFYSDNGGFSFTQLNPSLNDREGEAKAVEGRINFKELGWIKQDISAGAWWRKVDSGYSTSSNDLGADIVEYGVETTARLDNNVNIYARHSKAERGKNSYTQTQLTSEWRINDDATLSGEVRHIETKSETKDAKGTLGAIRYGHRVTESLELYGIGQLTLDDDNGAYDKNDALTLGGKYLYGDLSSIGVEGTTGSRGHSTQVYAEHRLNPDHTIYGNYTLSQSSSDYDSVFNSNRTHGWTIGQRWRLTDRLNMFNESQALKGDGSSQSNTIGMDYLLGEGWTSGFTVQEGKLTNASGGRVDRVATSVNIGRISQSIDWNSKLEWRKDTGAEHRRQWVLTNRAAIKLNESLRLSARFNYSDTYDYLSSLNGAKYIESGLGFAWRPWNNNRWAAFGRYTYLYDLSTSGQDNGTDYDQRTQIVSFEGVYKHDAKWEFAAKLARREGEVRFGRGEGQWFDSATTFAAGQVRYDLIRKWHALGEYRWLDVKNGGTKQGWLVGIDRDITENFRIGVGYNFTDFSDDLTKFDYKYKGFFINLVGRY
ncbi:hypothetical protein [Neisseria sp. Ec49-e6-T10]|uniref:hypothetical protein n=1 Tax=Neisseria sp. Ec49-e6-T10 TaxID=3140744 RepID=UPI003EBBA90A